MTTMVQKVLDVQFRLHDLRAKANVEGNQASAREFSLAITLSEDLVMRINRALAKADDQFVQGDYEQIRIDLRDAGVET